MKNIPKRISLKRNRFITIITFLFLCTFLNNCSSGYNEKGGKRDIKPIIGTKTFYFHVGSECDSIGYLVYKETGEVSSIVNIELADNCVFLCDPVNGNVKRIDINNGRIMASKKFVSNTSFLEFVEYFNDSLYAFAASGDVYIMNKELTVLDSFVLPNNMSGGYVYSNKRDSLVVFRNPTDLIQTKSNSTFIRAIAIMKNKRFKVDTVSIDNHEYVALLRKERGKEVKRDNKLIFETIIGDYEIPNNIVKSRDYDCINVDFSENHVAYFTVNKTKLKLVVYLY